MRLTARLHKLEGAVRPVRRAGRVPADPVAFGRAMLAGAFAVADLDPTDPDHTGWAAQVTAFLVTMSPEHQAWLRRARCWTRGRTRATCCCRRPTTRYSPRWMR